MNDNSLHNDNKMSDDEFVNCLSKIFCNKECCADYIRAMLSDQKNIDDLDENKYITSNVKLVKKSGKKDYDQEKIIKGASDVPKPEYFLTDGQFSNLPNEIKSAYLEKYFEIIDGNRFDYEKSLADNLKIMLKKYTSYPEGVFWHILRLRFDNFETDINDKKNNENDDFASKKSLATAIKNILDSNNFWSDEKKLALFWEYYEYFNGINENEKLDKEQNTVEQFKDVLKKMQVAVIIRKTLN